MQAYIVWFVAAAVLIAAELLSGTFYLLVAARSPDRAHAAGVAEQ